MNPLKLIASLDRSEDWNILVLLVCGGAVAGALTAEHLLSLEPCALCLTQRFFVYVGGLIAFASLWHEPRLGIYPILAILSFLAGTGFAVRQLWIMHVPGAATDCGASYSFLLEYDYPFTAVLDAFLKGSGDCAEPSLIPIWSLLAFLLLIALCIRQFLLGPRSSR